MQMACSLNIVMLSELVYRRRWVIRTFETLDWMTVVPTEYCQRCVTVLHCGPTLQILNTFISFIHSRTFTQLKTTFPTPPAVLLSINTLYYIYCYFVNSLNTLWRKTAEQEIILWN